MAKKKKMKIIDGICASRKGDELTIQLTPEIEQKMRDDPGLSDTIKNFLAAMHQAQHGVNTGQYESFEDGLEAITGNRPQPLESEE